MVKFPKQRDKKQIFRVVIILALVAGVSSLFFYYKNGSSNLDENAETLQDKNADVEGASVIANSDELTSICVASDIPSELKNILDESITSTYQLTEENTNCAVIISRFPDDTNEYDATWQSVLVPVIRFDSSLEEIESSNFSQLIRSRSYLFNSIIWSEDDSQFINNKFDVNFVQSFGNYDEISRKVKEDKNLIALLPISEVKPYMKVLPINSINPLDNRFNIFTYELSDFIWVKYINRDRSLRDQISLGFQNWEKERAFNPEKFTQVVLTGRSLLGAGQYYEKATSETAFDPLAQLRSTFNSAEMTAFSIDNTLASDCTQTANSTILCGPEDSLRWVKGGAVSLVGESILDYGREEFKYSLEKFKESGVEYFGGGLNRSEAQSGLNKKLTNINLSINSFSRVTPTRYLSTQTSSGNLSPDRVDGDGKILSDFLENPPESNFKIVELQLGRESDIYGKNTPSGTPADTYVKLATKKGADIIYLTYQNTPGGISVNEDNVTFWGLGDLMNRERSIDSTGIVVVNHFYEDKLLYFQLIPVTVGQDLQVKIADVDKKAEILNTVYNLSSIQ